MITTIPKEVIERWFDPTPISLEHSGSVAAEWLKATRGKSSLVEAFDYPIRGDFSFLRGFCEGLGIHVSPELWEWKKEREDEYEGIPF